MNESLAASRLKAFIRDVKPGGCAIISRGDNCQCPLCDVDNMTHEIHKLEKQIARLEDCCWAVINDAQYEGDGLCSVDVGKLTKLKDEVTGQ